jgi:hypothetical protein
LAFFLRSGNLAIVCHSDYYSIRFQNYGNHAATQRKTPQMKVREENNRGNMELWCQASVESMFYGIIIKWESCQLSIACTKWKVFSPRELVSGTTTKCAH